MRVPEALEPLVADGVIDEVLRPLMAGKEAQVWLVVAQGWTCVAKVYKDAAHRSFQQRAVYQEGRRARNSRTARAMAKSTKFGREQLEAGWKTAEVETLRRLREAGVHVPEPYAFEDGVLLMELVTDPDGNPAPRLADVPEMSEDDARYVFDCLVGDLVRMLCAGVVHGDLSDFNILLSQHGPVIIDFPQSTDAAANNNSRKLLIRDVDNVVSFMARFLPELADLPFGEELWGLYERGELRPDSRLTGTVKRERRRVDTEAILREIEDAEREARAKRAALGLPPPRPARAPVVYEEVPAGRGGKQKGRGGRGGPPAGTPLPPPQPVAPGKGAKGGRGSERPPPPKPAPRAAPPDDDLPDDLDALLKIG